MQKKFLFTFANYSDSRQQFFQTYTSPRNKEYCAKHGYEYLEYLNTPNSFRNHAYWTKFKIIQDMILNRRLNDGDVLLYLDADMCVHDLEIPFPSYKSFTYCIDSGNTHCMGSFSLVINEWSRHLVDMILDEHRYANLINKEKEHEPNNQRFSFWKAFGDQASWYSLAGIKTHSDIPFFNLAHYGWHSAKDEWTYYDLDQLYRNVEILPPCWNVTFMVGETSTHWNINNVNKEHCIIRHFAAGQPWLAHWFEKK